jgi:hypothetical protein
VSPVAVARAKRLIAVLTVTVLVFAIVAPGPAYGRGFFRGLKRAVGFVVSVPDKITRPLGPAAPLAQMWLLGKTPKFAKIIKKAGEANRAINDIETQKAKLNEVKLVYRTQAAELRRKAAALSMDKEALENILLAKGKDYWPAYKENVIALKNMEESLNRAADRLDKRADDLGVDDILKLFAGNAARTVLKNIEGVVFQEIGKEFDKLVDPRVVAMFVEKGGLGADGVIDLVIEGDVDRLIRKKGLAGRPDFEDLKKRLKQRVRAQMKEDAAHYRENWEAEIDKIIEELTKKAGTAVDDSPAPAAQPVNPTLTLDPRYSGHMQLISYEIALRAEPAGNRVAVSGSFNLTMSHQSEVNSSESWVWVMEGKLYETDPAGGLPKKFNLASDYTTTLILPDGRTSSWDQHSDSMLIGSLDGRMRGAGRFMDTNTDPPGYYLTWDVN